MLGRIERRAKEVMPRLIILDSVGVRWGAEVESQQFETMGDFLPKMARKALRGHLTCFIGHVTKEGGVAPPKTLERLVDATLHFEGERGRSLRMLRTHENRFGSTMEMGLFEMAPNGLVDIESPSAHLFAQQRFRSAG